MITRANILQLVLTGALAFTARGSFSQQPLSNADFTGRQKPTTTGRRGVIDPRAKDAAALAKAQAKRDRNAAKRVAAAR